MPLPLLLVPLATVAAPTMTASVTALVVAASTAVAGGFGALYWFIFEAPSSPKKQTSLTPKVVSSANLMSSKQSIEGAAESVTSLTKHVETTAALVVKTPPLITEAAKKVAQSALHIHESTQTLKKATTDLTSSTTTMEKMLPAIMSSAESFQEKTKVIAQRISIIQPALDATTKKLQQLETNIKHIQQIQSDQKTTITTLTDTVQTLTKENIGLRETIKVQESSIDQLAKEATRTQSNCQFFKQIALKRTPPTVLEPTQTSTHSSV